MAISLLGIGSEEKQLLEQSVNSILSESNFWSEDKKTLRSQQLQQKLNTLEQKRERDRRRLRDITESETIDQSVACGRYSGKAREIAEKVNLERNSYSWFEDVPQTDLEFQVSFEELQAVLAGIRRFKGKKEESALYVENVMPSNEFEQLVTSLTATLHYNEPVDDFIVQLKKIPSDAIKKLCDETKKLLDKTRRFHKTERHFIFCIQDTSPKNEGILCG
ncbi:MAG: hypothetical protein LBJ03_00570 [Holosporales bacterium]|nr:hypothetical protein [Holosporales bacterium]